MEEASSAKNRYISIGEILKHVGEFGPYQWLLEGICFFMVMATSSNTVMMYFVALEPQWKCTGNSSACMLNGTLPGDDNSRCDMPRSEWLYTEQLSYSIVTQFDINCNRQWLIYATTSVFFLGWAIGAVVLGWLSDNFGRKTVLMPSLCTLVLVSFSSSFSPNIYLFAFSRFIVGFSLPGVMIQAFILITESVGNKQRAFAGQVIKTGYPVGLCVLGLTAYFFREWKTVLILSTTPYILLVAFYKVVPESLRWLRIQGKMENLFKQLHIIARWNKKLVPSNLNISPVNEIIERKRNVFDIFGTRTLLVRSLVLGYAWFANGMVYYGLYLAANDLSGSIYRDFIVLSLIDFPATFLAIFLLQLIGRKRTVVLSMLAGGTACMAIGFIPYDSKLKIFRIVLGTTGKFFILMSFNSLYTWSAEIYPTEIRSIGIGFVQFICRVGGATAPWIAKGLKYVNRGAPFIMMGIVAVTAALLSLILPETKDRSIDCVNDTESIPKHNNMTNNHELSYAERD